MSLSKETLHPLRHVAIIMDGNNRWAKQRALGGIAGHEAGAERVRDVLRAARELNVEVVTLFAFSSENWNRPELEVRGLMSLLSTFLKRERKQLSNEGVELRVVGSRKRLSERLVKLIDDVEKETRIGSKLVLNLCIDYGGRWDIVEAAKEVAREVKQGRLRIEDVTEATLQKHLNFHDLPEPDLCIRTAGEQRISNFLLWQFAYTEFYFADCYWPDFDEAAFKLAADDYYSRQRRFGLRDEQVGAAQC